MFLLRITLHPCIPPLFFSPMKSTLAGASGIIVVAGLLASLGSLNAQDTFYLDGAKRIPLIEESSWTAYELAPGSDPVKVEADVRRGARKALDRTSVYDPKRRLLAVPAENAAAPKGAVRKVRLFKNGSADPIIETRELVVRFKDGVTRARANKILKPLQGTILSRIGDYAPNAYLVEVPATVSSIDTANRLQALPEVRYAQPDLIWPKVSRFIPNDPVYPLQWHLNNPGGAGGIPGADIKAERAWEITRGDPDVVIAILDDGVATNHEDFAAGKFTGGWDFVSNDNDPRPARTVDNHGTSCAGLAAASGHNGIGVSGVAPDCRLMAVRMLGPGTTPTVEAAAIAHAKNNGAWVISNSWGPADGTGATDPCPQIVSDAIIDAADNGRGGKGCVILWAAGNGNESSDLDGYASHPKVICVAATMRDDTTSPYSDFGNGVDICAPGGASAGDMVTVDRMGAAGYDPTANYTVGFNGTSAATPVAAGVAALILSAEPDLTRQQVTQRLIDTADFVDTDNVTYDANGHHIWYGFGRVNAFAALAAADDDSPGIAVAVPSQGQVTPSAPTASGTTSDIGYGASRVHWWIFNTVTGKWWNPGTSSWQDGTGSGDTVIPVADNWSIPLPETGEGSFQLHVKVEDKAGNESAFIVRDYQIDNSSPTLTIGAPAAGNQPTSPPVASGTATDGGSGVKEVRVSIRNTTTDRWWKWSTSTWTGPAFVWADHVVLADGTTSWSRSLPALPEGSYELFIQALDNNDGASAWTPRSFSIDGVDPVVTFTGLANQQQVFEFSNVSGTVSEPASVTLKLTEFNVSGSNRFWNGSTWTTNESDPGVWRQATVSGTTWHPQSPLPGRGNTREGHYILEVKAVDVANKQDLESLVLIRTATDSSLPELSIFSPVSGEVLTEPVLPLFSGTASDPESGIAGVSLYLMRSTGSGFTYWTGSGWSLTPTELPANSNGSTWSAPVTSGPGAWSLPSYGQIVNGAWQIQASATNGETPAGTRGTSVSFTVDYHPVYEYTAGSYNDGDQHNDNSLWSNPANWSPYGVPGANDIALIRNGHNVTSTTSLNLYGLDFISGSLTFSAGPGPDGHLTTSGRSEWKGGTFNGLWTNSGTLAINSPDAHWLWNNSSLINTGTVTHSSGGIIGRENSTITNAASGTWITAASGDIFGQYNAGNQFINQGILRHTAATDSEFNEWTFTIGGEVQKQGAALVIRANATLPAGTQFTGPGSFRIADGTITANGSLSNSGGSFHHAGGTIVSGTPVTFNGNQVWSGGAWQGNLTLSAGSTLAITGPTQLNTGTILNNAGVVSWITPNPLVGRENTRINNLPGAVWRLESTGDAFANYNGGNVFNNEGKLEKISGDTTLLRHWDYLMPGETKANTGTLFLAANWTWPAGALFSGAGTIQMADGTITLGGEVFSTAASLRFTGGTMNGAPGAKIQGNWTWSGGSIGGSFENPVNRTLTFDGSSQLNFGATLLNNGTVRWQGTSPLVGRENVAVTNAAGATWEIAVAGTPFANYNAGNSFTNHGLFTRTAPAGDIHVHSWTYHQHGVFHAAAGDTRIGSTLNLMAGCSFTGAGNFLLLDHTWLKGATTFTAPVTTSGHFHGEAAGLAHGTLRWSAGIMEGTVKVASGATMRVVSPAGRSLWYSSLIDCSGEIVWEDGGVEGRENATLRIRNGGIFRVQSAGTFYNYNFNNHVVIDDGGTFEKTSEGTSFIHWAFDNDGSATVNAGLLSLHGGGTGDGVFAGNTGGVLRFADGPHVLEGGAVTTGNTEITSGSVVASGAAGGRMDVKGGTFGSTGTGVFSFADASTCTGGILYGQLRVPVGASLAITGPADKWVWVSSTLEVSGLMEWQGGHPIMGRENSTIDVKPGGTFRVIADGDLFANYNGGNRLLVAGTFEKTGGSGATTVDEWSVEGAGTIRPATGRIDFNTIATFNGGTRYEGSGKTRFNAGNLIARGTATIATGATVEFSGATISGHADGSATFQGGAIDWSAGAVTGVITLNSTTQTTGPTEKWIWVGAEVRNAGTMTVGGTGWLLGRENSRLVNLPAGTMTCTGTSSFGNYNEGNRLVNEGLLRIGTPVGRHVMHWTFQQAATGTLAIEVGGSNAATPDFDILQVHRTAQLAGTLVVTKVNGYLPPEDTLFSFLTGSPLTGTFATVLAPGFDIEYAANSATLRATAAGLTFADWAEDEELEGPDALPEADPDHDGLVNFLEYAFNSDPNAPGASPVSSGLLEHSGNTWLVVRYRRWQDRIDAGVAYQPQASPDLGAWDGAGVLDETDPDAPLVPGSEARRCLIPVGGSDRFLRLEVD